ncbi:hypothetical protein ACIBF6_35015 [Streptosporangium amethystogenes]|uniref:pPIWI_RE_Z domain-containing protein n=1 Tax=Streptosporangium amethystogenes TaxID=2002 RepID=UPI00379303BE
MRNLHDHLREALSTIPPAEAAEYNALRKKLDYTVELGLRVIELVSPQLAPIDGWPLFGGYPFSRARSLAVSWPDDELRRILRAARYHLESMHRREVWRSALLQYRQLPELDRAYDFAESLAWPATPKSPSRAAHRQKLYDALLSSTPPFTASRITTAEPGPHLFRGRTIGTQHITIPEDLPPPLDSRLSLVARHLRQAFDQPVESLRQTAEKMAKLDQPTPGRPKALNDWESRFLSMELSTLDEGSGSFAKADRLVVDGLLNLIGIPGVGKSTLRDILATHAVAELGQRVVLVVGDVAEALRVAEGFNRLREAADRKSEGGDKTYAGWDRLHAIPLVGASTRDQHTRRLHRRLRRISPLPLLHQDAAFAYLSTACPLSALRGAEADGPLPYQEAPCQWLIPLDTASVAGESAADLAEEKWGPRRGCPMWSHCPRHDAARGLREATIWVATPEALAVSSVPVQQNPERVRYLELACRTADLLIVDEADQVQIRLDHVFAPTATLYKPGDDSWLDEINRHNVAELAREGRIQLSNEVVQQWTAALDTVSTTANRIYAMLVSDDELRDWVGSDLFTVWSLQLELVGQWPATRLPNRVQSAAERMNPKHESRQEASARLLAHLSQDPGATQEARDKRREAILKILDGFRDDPVGDNDEEELSSDATTSETLQLAELARRLVTNRPGSPRVAAELNALLAQLAGLRDPQELSGTDLKAEMRENVKAELSRGRRRFEFTLLVAILHDRLNLLTTLWPRVETALKLDPSANALYHSSPADYDPVIPESPMGNILAFQFVADARGAYAQTGELRFIRCTGVGRELLSALPTLHAVDGSHGPNVVLMSGTSWAGASTRYHLAEPVKAVLHARARAEEREKPCTPKITMFTPFVYDAVEDASPQDPMRPLQLSGTSSNRSDVLWKMLRGLADPDPADQGGRSRFAQELGKLPPSRRHLLVLTGSYKDAREAGRALHSSREWRNRACVLISDDEEAAFDTPRYDPDKNQDTPTLRRGDLATFGSTGYTILVAPLQSVERGHNILNDQEKALFGSVYFLARPLPTPSDVNVLIHALNDLTVRRTRPGGSFDQLVQNAVSLDAAGLEWRRQARRELHRLANRQLMWKRLCDSDREYLTWDLLVVMWQVIGRLTRGGVDARVHFVDAAFAPRRAAGLRGDSPRSSLLVSMRDVLAPYFGDAPDWQRRPAPPHRLPATEANIYLADALYRPLYDGLKDLLLRPPAAVPRHGDERRWR